MTSAHAPMMGRPPQAVPSERHAFYLIDARSTEAVVFDPQDLYSLAQPWLSPGSALAQPWRSKNAVISQSGRALRKLGPRREAFPRASRGGKAEIGLNGKGRPATAILILRAGSVPFDGHRLISMDLCWATVGRIYVPSCLHVP